MTFAEVILDSFLAQDIHYICWREIKSISMASEGVSYKKYIRGFWIVFSTIIIGIVFLFFMIAGGHLGFMPSFEELENPDNILASEIYSADGKEIGKYFYTENRSSARYENLPESLINALIATEDIRFKKHSGIDLRGLIRVFKGLATGSSSSGGGSTITQQLAKMLFPRERFTNKFKLVIRKFKEWVIAVKLEKSYTKEEILTMYLNKYDFLNLAVGIKSASKIYFNIPPDSLKIHQSAMLVGMAKNSALYNPVRRPELTKQRRNVVLSQMEKYGYISKAEYDSLKLLPLGLDFHKVDFKQGLATYFRESLRLILNAGKPDIKNYASWQHQKFIEDSVEWENNPLFGWCKKNFKPNGENYNLYKDGLKIYTTLDSRMQRYAEESVVQHLKNNLQPIFDRRLKSLRNPPFSDNMSPAEVESLLDRSIRQSERYRVLRKAGKDFNEIKKIFKQPVEMTVFSWDGDIDTTMAPLDSIKWYLRYFRSSLMAVETKTGKVKAYVGGPDYKYFMYDMVKGGKRQVGSTVKPFLYTLAMQNGLSPCQKVPYVRQQFILDDGSVYEPKDSENDEKNYGKMVTLRWGLSQSRNMISAWVLKQFNPQAVVDIMKKLGVYSPIDPVPSMFLGTSDITLYEMVGAFATYANKGVFTRPYFVTRIENRHGNVVASFVPERHEAIDEKTAYLMLNLMQAVIDEGTGNRLRWHEDYGQFKIPIAGKTGTTQNHSDGWFIGVTPELSAGVWTGADLRSIHFGDIHTGQGANMALPTWGYFMKKVLADSTLGYTEDVEFEKPLNFHMDLDCDKVNKSKSNSGDFDDFF